MCFLEINRSHCFGLFYFRLISYLLLELLLDIIASRNMTQPNLELPNKVFNSVLRRIKMAEIIKVKSLALTTVTLCVIVLCSNLSQAAIAPLTPTRRATCTSEIENANRTVANWATTMRQMVDGSALPSSLGESVNNERNKIQDLVVGFGANMNKRPIERLVEDLVTIRRRSNRMALNVYLKTYDVRWPQTSVQLGVAVERVQQACLSNLDRAAMLVLNSPFSSTKYQITQQRKSPATN